MLTVPKLSYAEARKIERLARGTLDTHTCKLRPDDVCMACRYRSADERPPLASDWLLTYVAAGEEIPEAWAPEAFRTLGDESHYAARIRGYLLERGMDCLRFRLAEED